MGLAAAGLAQEQDGSAGLDEPQRREVIDDVGLLPMDRAAASAFYQVVNQRYEKQHSTIVTTNRGLPDWGEIFGDTVVAAAILDRLMHDAIVFNIKGSSWRLREHQALTTAVTDPTERRRR